MFVDQKIVGLRVAILDIIHTRFTDTGEIELHIVIFEIGSPWFDLTREDFLLRTVVLDAVEVCIRLRDVLLVEFDPQHEPSILGQHTAIIEFQLCVTADTYHALRVIGCHDNLMTCLQRQRIDEAVCTTIIVGLEALELTGLLTVRTGDSLTCSITREAVQTTIHREGLQPVT